MKTHITPTHYYLGLIPCEIPHYNPDTCMTVHFDDGIIDIWGKDRLFELNQTFNKEIKHKPFIAIKDMDEFLNSL